MIFGAFLGSLGIPPVVAAFQEVFQDDRVLGGVPFAEAEAVAPAAGVVFEKVNVGRRQHGVDLLALGQGDGQPHRGLPRPAGGEIAGLAVHPEADVLLIVSENEANLAARIACKRMYRLARLAKDSGRFRQFSGWFFGSHIEGVLSLALLGKIDAR